MAKILRWKVLNFLKISFLLLPIDKSNLLTCILKLVCTIQVKKLFQEQVRRACWSHLVTQWHLVEIYGVLWNTTHPTATTVLVRAEGSKSTFGSWCNASRKYTNKFKNWHTSCVFFTWSIKNIGRFSRHVIRCSGRMQTGVAKSCLFSTAVEGGLAGAPANPELKATT